jgi:hypothetical protein
MCACAAAFVGWGRIILLILGSPVSNSTARDGAGWLHSTNLGTNVPDAAAPNFKDPGSQCEGSNSLHDSVKDSVSRRSNGQCQLVLQLAAWLAVMASYGRGYTCEPSCALRHALFAYHVSSTISLILIQLVLCLPQVLVQTCHFCDSGTSSTLP